MFEDPYLTTDEKTWDNGLFGFRIDLPLRTLPAESERPLVRPAG